MEYIVAYTIKRKDEDELDDFYLTFDDDNYPSYGDALKDAQSYYNVVLSECPSEIEEGWHVHTASISIIIKSTDF
jgi:hypothetical protein